MTSTELKIGMSPSSRPSSRVIKPPGGGHTNIFGEPEVAVNAPRPKYNQQNSSNMNACIGSTDPNKVVEKLREETGAAKQTPPEKTEAPVHVSTRGGPPNTNGNGIGNANGNGNNANTQRGRVPPGGFSSGGFW